MENILEFREKIVTDVEFVSKEDFEEGAQIRIISDTQDLLIYNDGNLQFDDTIFMLWIEAGKEKEKIIMLHVPIDELELFAKSVINHIDIIRANYGDHIKKQTNLGINI
jgi:hypothetical protein